MKKCWRLKLFVLLCVVGFSFSGRAQTYDALWRQYDKAMEKELPKSAEEIAGKIYIKAEKEGNFSQLLYAFIRMSEAKNEVTPDSIKMATEKLELMLTNEKDVVRAAVLHYVLAETYRQLPSIRTARYDEEARELYSAREETHRKQAFANMEALASAKADDYIPLVRCGRDRSIYGGDVLNVMLNSCMESDYKEKVDLLSSAIDIYERRGNRSAATLMKLDRLCALRHVNKEDGWITQPQFLDMLEKLWAENESIDTGADVALELMNGVSDDSVKLVIACKAMKLYPKSVLYNNFKRCAESITTPNVVIGLLPEIWPGIPANIEVEAKNLSAATLKVVNRITKKVVDRRVLRFPYKGVGEPHIEKFKDTVTVTLAPGKYKFVLEAKGYEDNLERDVTSMRVQALRLPDGNVRVIVVDNITGRPVSGAKIIDTSERNGRKPGAQAKVFDVGTDGEYLLKDKDVTSFRVRTSAENETGEVWLNRYYGEVMDEAADEKYSVFTDRGIYRPGQTVHVSGIVYAQKGDSTAVVAGKECVLTLLDANRKEIAKKRVATNAMGSVDADFALPSVGLNGMFCVRLESAYAYFRVEEYKRPTFCVETKIESVKADSSFAFGDEVMVKGTVKTFSGGAVQGAAVKYSVTVSAASFWRMRELAGREIVSGELVTDENGNFTFPLSLDDLTLREGIDVLRFRVRIDVTDLAGESHESECSVNVSRNAFLLSAAVPDYLDQAADASLVVNALNMVGKNVDVEGDFHIYKKEKDGNLSVTPLLSGRFRSGICLDFTRFRSLPLGDYAMKAVARDDKGHEIEVRHDFVLFTSEMEAVSINGLSRAWNGGKEMRVCDDWLFSPDNTFAPGKPAYVYFAPKEKDTYTYYNVFTKNGLVEGGTVVLDGRMMRLRLDYKEEWGDGIELVFFYVRNGHVCYKRMDVTLTRPEKNLSLAWTTFRDKLRPGQEEEWTLSVKDKDGKPVSAEVLMAMYDASLDKLRGHSWNFSLYFPRRIPFVQSFRSAVEGYGGLWVGVPVRRILTKGRSFDKFVTLWHSGRNTMRVFECVTLGSADTEMEDAAAPMARNMAETKLMRKSSAVVAGAYGVAEESFSDDSEDTAADADNGGDGEDIPVVLRSNFAETAFFMPHVMTDANGEACISFTLPESLTEWKFMGLAHTEGVDYGQIISTAVARKDFMVQPNMPRFVRVGDKVAVSARILNLGGEPLSGKVQMRLIDPETEKTVYRQTVKFGVDANATSSVSFSFDATDKYPVLICEIVAAGKNFSDGERNYLPVLTSKKMVTETVPFFMDEKGELEVNVDALFNNGSSTATERRMTVEYTANPSWTAIQALESVSVPEQASATSYAASLYANVAVKWIVDNAPYLHDVIRIWTDEIKNTSAAGAKNSALRSELEKNEELKDILLRESPWVLEADDEREQRRQLITLFDEDVLHQRINLATDKLGKMQKDDGSWGWFDGMSGNSYITLMVCENLARSLKWADGDNEGAVMRLLERGMVYLDKEELRTYNDMLKHKVRPVASGHTLRYLYVSSLLARRKVSADVRKMRDVYLTNAAKDISSLTIYGRANVACALNAFDKEKEAKDFVRSLREHIVAKEGMGRYFDSEKALYSWMDYRIPTQLAAMRSFRELATDFPDTEAYLNDMTLWLLRQKQAQKWDNSANTVDAADFILGNGELGINKEKAEEAVALPEIRVNGRLVNLSAPTASLGYVKETVEEKSIYKSRNKVVVNKTTNGISWGAVYGQCLDDMDKLMSSSSGELSVECKLYVERRDASGKTEWIPLVDNWDLKVGDKLRIRHVITADRDLDFVQVRSQHAACLEPVRALSDYQNAGGRGCYLSVRDASADIFFDRFTKGTTTVELDFYIVRTGVYQQGVATVQCAYASHLAAHTAGRRIVVK